jgi:tRNA threonylcarbamoyladenosine biosynthesis protein TsaB
VLRADGPLSGNFAATRLCHADVVMPVDQVSQFGVTSSQAWSRSRLVLGIDTCGPSGSVALGRLVESSAGIEILGQLELEGRSYSATLIVAVGELLQRDGLALNDLYAIVAVNGPGSFTGVRVGLSAAKGLAEAAALPIVAVSRLEVLATKAGVSSSALDAHRSEVFVRLGGADRDSVELLASLPELRETIDVPIEVGVCDEAAAALIESAWPTVGLVRVSAPDAADALRLAASRVQAGNFVDPMLLDGHYLRRSDAEIFGEPIAMPPIRA